MSSEEKSEIDILNLTSGIGIEQNSQLDTELDKNRTFNFGY